MPETEWPTEQDYLARINEKWDEEVGDCRQELVFIGQNLPSDILLKQLHTCLLTEEEMAEGIEYCEKLPDPFPEW